MKITIFFHFISKPTLQPRHAIILNTLLIKYKKLFFCKKVPDIMQPILYTDAPHP